MPPRVKSRVYDNSRREAAALETRRAVVDAAHRLFLEKGYGATSVTDVAAAAGVSVQTVYSRLGSKRALLKEAIDVAIAGDHEPLAIRERPEVAAIQAEPDPERKLRLHARLATSIAARLEPVERVLRSAAAVDPEVREELLVQEAGRLAGMRELAQHLADVGALRPDLSVDAAAQRVWVLIGVTLYRPLVIEQGWSAEEFETYLGDLLIASLLPARPAAARAGARKSGRKQGAERR